MKHRLPNLLLLALTGAIWLYRCHMSRQEWACLAACFVCCACIILIPHRAAGPIAAAAATVGMSMFFRQFLFCYAPTLFACAALHAAVADKNGKPPYKDPVLLVSAALSAACASLSLWHAIIEEKDSAFMRPELERIHIYAIFFTAGTLFLCVDALRLYRKRRTAPKAPGDPLYIELAVAYAAMLVSYAAVAILYLKDVSTGKMSLLPVVMGAFFAVTEGIGVYAARKGPEEISSTRETRRTNT